jgi:hypothetical protein
MLCSLLLYPENGQMFSIHCILKRLQDTQYLTQMNISYSAMNLKAYLLTCDFCSSGEACHDLLPLPHHHVHQMPPKYPPGKKPSG